MPGCRPVSRCGGRHDPPDWPHVVSGSSRTLRPVGITRNRFRASGWRRHSGHRQGCAGRAAPRGQRRCAEHRDGRVIRTHHGPGGPFPSAGPPAGRIRSAHQADWVPAARASRHSADCWPGGRPRHDLRARGDCRRDHGARRHRVAQPDVGRGERSGQRTRDPGPAAQWPIVSTARAAAARRASGAGGRQRCRRRPHAEDLDQRRASRDEQLPAGRHRHQQRLQQDAGLGRRRAARCRSGARISGPHQRLLGRIRTLGRRRLQRRHAIGREPLYRVSVRVPSQLGARCPELLRSAVATKAQVHAASVWRRLRRSGPARSYVLFRRLRRARRASRHYGRDRRPGR